MYKVINTLTNKELGQFGSEEEAKMYACQKEIETCRELIPEYENEADINYDELDVDEVLSMSIFEVVFK
ncbi:TPA: hypothetical protein ACG6RF_002054 [Streptococcus agalactiae]|nr:hypothetical protein [Streptococcus agalactiae]HEO2267431.1 hypothetical protein [Streptococcus agalactiae]HEO7770433.1 hypothetical protein [Streptococcus agalactiae]